MAVELLETLKEAITAYTGLSPNAFFTVIAAGIAVYYLFSVLFGGPTDHPRPRSFEEDAQPLPPPVQLGEISAEELKGYDGNDPEKPLLMAIKGQIYDVSQSRMFYGPGGPYALFAGKDASRALAKMSFEDKDLTGDVTGLGAFELDALQDWEYKFMSKYVKVGTIKKSEDAPEASTAAVEPAEPTTAEPAEPTAAEPSTAAAHVSPSCTEFIKDLLTRVDELGEVKKQIALERLHLQQFQFLSFNTDNLSRRDRIEAEKKKSEIREKLGIPEDDDDSE